MIAPDMDHDEDPDIVQVVLQRVIAVTPGFNAALAAQVEAEIRARYGGRRVRIPKRGKYLSTDQKLAAYKDALTDMPTPEVLKKHKISLATLYRLGKKPPDGAA